ncbi:MAG: hypothetical protein BJ554DRAFT_4361, partial [Olpidium bornovanus]
MLGLSFLFPSLVLFVSVPSPPRHASRQRENAVENPPFHPPAAFRLFDLGCPSCRLFIRFPRSPSSLRRKLSIHDERSSPACHGAPGFRKRGVALLSTPGVLPVS